MSNYAGCWAHQQLRMDRLAWRCAVSAPLMCAKRALASSAAFAASRGRMNTLGTESMAATDRISLEHLEALACQQHSDGTTCRAGGCYKRAAQCSRPKLGSRSPALACWAAGTTECCRGRLDARHLYSGAATIILASCGSSGNSAIMAPTCGRAGRHRTGRQTCLFQTQTS